MHHQRSAHRTDHRGHSAEQINQKVSSTLSTTNQTSPTYEPPVYHPHQIYVHPDSEQFPIDDIIYQDIPKDEDPQQSSQRLKEFHSQSCNFQSKQSRGSLERVLKGSQKAKQKAKNVQNQRNQNVLKKIGRTILKNRSRYDRKGKKSKAIEKMITNLSQKVQSKGKINKSSTNNPNQFQIQKNYKQMGDNFNTTHLKIMLSQEEECTHILNVTRSLLNETLRKDILNSSQIKDKLKYLKTYKCFSLRFCCTELACRIRTGSNKQKFSKNQ